MGCLGGALAPPLKTISPLSFLRRGGIKGVRLINNLLFYFTYYTMVDITLVLLYNLVRHKNG